LLRSKETPPGIPDAYFAAIEAEAITDLITAASASPRAVLSDDSIENAGYMLMRRVATMRKFIEAKRDEERGKRDEASGKSPRAIAG
jgi:hypothetical protein